jgi:hypothetical protein
MLVDAAKTCDPRPSAPVVTTRAAVGLHFDEYVLGFTAICPSPTTHPNRDARAFHRRARKDEPDKDALRERCSQRS